MSTPIKVSIRWLIRADMTEVLEIERGNFAEYAWSEREFILALRQRNCIGMVAEDNDRVIGYMLYELHAKRLTLLNFAVDVECQRRGIGRQMVEKLVGKLHRERRTHITVEVRERNLLAQLFLKAMGFEAVAVLRDYYEEVDDEAAYVFRRSIKEAALV